MDNNKNSEKKSINKKKVLNIIGMGVQILIVFGVLAIMFLVGKRLLDKYAIPEKETFTSVDNNKETSEDEINDLEDDKPEKSDNKYDGGYHIYVNRRHNVVIAYGYDESGEEIPMKIMSATIGPELENGNYKVIDNHSWYETSRDTWSQYNTESNGGFLLQSISYSAKNKYSLKVKEYNLLGERNESGNAVRLKAVDARWIFANCQKGTKVTVNSDKKIPIDKPSERRISTVYGWDPSDPSKKNPWKNKSDGTISAFSDTIRVERGAEVNYLANLIAIDKKGKNVLRKLEYDEFDSSIEGTYEVKYTYGTKKNKMKATLTYKVVDTVEPQVTIDTSKKSDFVVKIPIKEYTTETLNSQEVKDSIINKITANTVILELGQEISAKLEFVFPETMYTGKNLVEIIVQDNAGNKTHAGVYITIKEKKIKEKTTKEKATEEKTTKKKKATEEKTTKKKKATKEKTTKKKKATKEKTSTKIQKETESKTDEESEKQGEQSAGDI